MPASLQRRAGTHNEDKLHAELSGASHSAINKPLIKTLSAPSRVQSRGAALCLIVSRKTIADSERVTFVLVVAVVVPTIVV